jgi:hypothetical protein
MKTLVHLPRRYALGLAAVVIVLGFAAEQPAFAQRRGRMIVPQRPAVINSSPMIEGLNKALTALAATNEYDGHRETAIKHINAAIKDLEVPGAKKSSEPAAASAPEKGSTIAQADSDANLQKALKALYAVHHDLTDKAATKGRIHADAQVRIAIDELVKVQKGIKAAAPAAAPAAPAAAPATRTAPTSSFTTKPVR